MEPDARMYTLAGLIIIAAHLFFSVAVVIPELGNIKDRLNKLNKRLVILETMK